MAKQPTRPELAKTSLALPKVLWTEIKVRAVREGRDAQDLVAEALVAYLRNTPPKTDARLPRGITYIDMFDEAIASYMRKTTPPPKKGGDRK